MATLTKKHTYKGGGASYGLAGIRASVYVGPKMFNGTLPETIEFDGANLATPDAADEAKAAARAERNAGKEARKTEREAKRAERATAREAKKAERVTQREQQKTVREQKRQERIAAKVAADAQAAEAQPEGETVSA